MSAPIWRPDLISEYDRDTYTFTLTAEGEVYYRELLGDYGISLDAIRTLPELMSAMQMILEHQQADLEELPPVAQVREAREISAEETALEMLRSVIKSARVNAQAETEHRRRIIANLAQMDLAKAELNPNAVNSGVALYLDMFR